jgi:hypothetical protein
VEGGNGTSTPPHPIIQHGGNGVLTLVGASAAAPAVSSRLATARCPFLAALCRGVSPSCRTTPVITQSRHVVVHHIEQRTRAPSTLHEASRDPVLHTAVYVRGGPCAETGLDSMRNGRATSSPYNWYTTHPS